MPQRPRLRRGCSAATAVAAAAAATAVVVGLPGAAAAAAAHYACQTGDEVSGELMGESGLICSPRCAEGTFECPTNVPAGTAAEPQCLLQDVDKVAYCALFCETEGQCPSGDVCWRAAAMEVGICIKPLAFAEWAQVGVRRKLDLVGVPSRAGAQATGFRIAKAYNALMSLKMRFNMVKGDADVLEVEEFLSVAKATHEAAKSAQKAAPARAVAGGGPPGVFRDASYFAGNLARGVPGLEREASDTLWKLEHLEQRYVASDLLRGVIEVGLLYLLGGCAYKHQALGARGVEMIPHIEFWREYPSLVADGVSYAAQLGYSFLGSGGGFSGGGLATKRPPGGGFQQFGPGAGSSDDLVL